MDLTTGTYVSEDGEHTLRITSLNVSTGRMVGSVTTTTPEGVIEGSGTNQFYGEYAFSSGRAVTSLSWAMHYHSENYSFVISDMWTGCTKSSTNQLLMSGSRAYINIDGVREVYSFKDILFNKK